MSYNLSIVELELLSDNQHIQHMSQANFKALTDLGIKNESLKIVEIWVFDSIS